MRADELAMLQQVRQARAEGAAAALRRAESAQYRAAAQRVRAEQAATDFVTTRHAHEAAVQRALSAGPVPSQRLRQAAAQLSGLAAHAEMLRQRATQAATQAASCDDTASLARRTHIAAQRAALGVGLLDRQIAAVSRAAGERGLEAELDAVAGRRQPVMAMKPTR